MANESAIVGRERLGEKKGTPQCVSSYRCGATRVCHRHSISRRSVPGTRVDHVRKLYRGARPRTARLDFHYALSDRATPHHKPVLRNAKQQETRNDPWFVRPTDRG